MIREKEREREIERERMGLREGRKSAWERKRERENVRSRERGGEGGISPSARNSFHPRHLRTDMQRETGKGRRVGRKGDVHQLVVADLLSAMHEEAPDVFSLFSLQALLQNSSLPYTIKFASHAH